MWVEKRAKRKRVMSLRLGIDFALERSRRIFDNFKREHAGQEFMNDCADDEAREKNGKRESNNNDESVEKRRNSTVRKSKRWKRETWRAALKLTAVKEMGRCIVDIIGP